MKLLLVGDVHATVDSLDECQRLLDEVHRIYMEEQPDNVVFLGDLFHNHSIVHLSVQKFWDDAFSKFKRALALVGNHDRPGIEGADEHALMLYDNIWVIDKLHHYPCEKVLFLPYMSDHEKFIELCNLYKHEADILITHMSFSGAKMDNGFFDPHGIDASLIPQKHIISGHIHTSQEFDKVWYPGAPRWRTVSDANKERAVWMVEIEKGEIISRKSFDTKVFCNPIYVLEDSPDAPLNLEDLPKGNVTVDIHGPQEYVDQQKKKLDKAGIKSRPFPTTQRNIKVKESEGVISAFKKFTEGYKAANATPPEVLLKMAQERISWLKLKST